MDVLGVAEVIEVGVAGGLFEDGVELGIGSGLGSDGAPALGGSER